MDHEAEVIKGQMEETREDLAKKLETLEHQVAGAVQNVTGTVEAVSHTVEQVKEAVEGTVESVKDSMTNTMESVKESVRETFDIHGHVQRHPWLGLGGSVAAGFLAGRLMRRFLPDNKEGPRTSRARARDGSPSLSTLVEPARQNGRGAEARREEEAPPLRREERRPGWLESLTTSLGPQIGKLKGLAIGTALGLVRDQVSRAIPGEMSTQLTDVINDFTTKLGGEVIHGPVLQSLGAETAGPHGSQPPGHQGAGRHEPSSSSGPAW